MFGFFFKSNKSSQTTITKTNVYLIQSNEDYYTSKICASFKKSGEIYETVWVFN